MTSDKRLLSVAAGNYVSRSFAVIVWCVHITGNL